MNQRSLTIVGLTTGGPVTTGAATHGVFDISQNTATTQGWTYASIGRREMKLLAAIANNGTTAAQTMTQYTVSLFGSTVSTGASATFLVATTATTWGGAAEAHFTSNFRYAYIISNYSGVTTGGPSVGVMVEQRAA